MIYMAATLAAGTPFKHERLEAAEIPETASWSEGIKILENGALSDAVETSATLYIDDKAKREKWIFGKEGEVDEVKYKTTDIVAGVERELTTHPSQSIALCKLHTHTLSGGEYVSFINEEERRNIREGKHSASFPPSGYAMSDDISLFKYAKLHTALDNIRKKGVAVETRNGVVDPAGITYHRIAFDEDLKKEFPHYFAEVEQLRAVGNEWEKAIKLALENLDAETLDRLHRLTEKAGMYDQGIYKDFPPERIAGLKRTDLEMALITEGKGSEEISRALVAGKADLQRLYDDFVRLVLGSSDRDQKLLYQARRDWIRTSMSVSPQQLTSTKEYGNLREAFARNAAYIRFVPHSQVPNEPPCAGTDYKP